MRLIDADLLAIYKYKFDIFEEVSPQTAFKDDEGETDGVECSVCGYTDINEYWAKTYYRFCPNCGAKMGEIKDG